MTIYTYNPTIRRLAIIPCFLISRESFNNLGIRVCFGRGFAIHAQFGLLILTGTYTYIGREASNLTTNGGQVATMKAMRVIRRTTR